ncbi:MAG: hypothetical protein RIT27_487 [Pseudomonadota bacterium]|jgi:uncharacterized protein YciI
MLYAIMGEDVENSLEKRLAVRAEHLARLEVLQHEGRLILAGPFPLWDNEDLSNGVSGSLIVAEFSSLEDAQNWATADPYFVTGVFKNVSVKPFKKVFPQ